LRLLLRSGETKSIQVCVSVNNFFSDLSDFFFRSPAASRRQGEQSTRLNWEVNELFFDLCFFLLPSLSGCCKARGVAALRPSCERALAWAVDLLGEVHEHIEAFAGGRAIAAGDGGRI
jgi:hypothetical protein